MATYNIYEAKTNFSRLVEEAAHGEEVVIAKAGKPVLRMVPIVEEKKVGRREFGQNAMGFGPIDLEAYPEAYDDLPLDMFEVLRDHDGDGETSR
jgi:prevent-host-death family protein